MLDSRWIPVLLVTGWLLVTLGLWGALGRQWWIWPLSLGVLSLGAGAAFGWAAILQMRRAGAGAPQRVGRDPVPMRRSEAGAP